MRIGGPKDLTKTSKKSGAGKASGAGQRFVVGAPGQTSGLSGTSGPQTISNIGTLIAAQEVDEKVRQHERAVTHGSDMLDVLDQLKVSLLNGRLSPQMINHLRKLIAQKGDFQVDDGLKQVLSHIELRAEVELAKLAKQKSKIT